MKPMVFVPDPIAASGIELLESHCEVIAPWRQDAARAIDNPQAHLARAEGVIVRLFCMQAAEIASATRLKVIAKHGVGVDSIDVSAATARGISVVYTPTANANAVVEHTLALLLALARNLPAASVMVAQGRFNERVGVQAVELAGKTLGVVGLGRVGAGVAAAARHGLGMQVLAYDPFVAADKYTGPATIEPSLERLLGLADFLTFHLPLTPQTHHLLNAERLRLLRPTCRLVNTSRGAVIDELALAQTLTEGRIAGAALDVFEQEPLPMEHPLVRAPQTLLTPHIAGATRESLDRMARDSAQGVLDVLQGRRATHVVNPEVWH